LGSTLTRFEFTVLFGADVTEFVSFEVDSTGNHVVETVSKVLRLVTKSQGPVVNICFGLCQELCERWKQVTDYYRPRTLQVLVDFLVVYSNDY
jgi:hypothetical protein